jgi:starvation-inducible DNA-binding protein
MLADDLKTLLASTASLYIKSSNFHWNIISPDFPQYHGFLGSYYSSVSDQIDTIAEYIRIIGSFTPGSLKQFQDLSIIEDQDAVVQPPQLFSVLLADNQLYLNLLDTCFKSATDENQQGIANYLAERLDYHAKQAWQIRAILGVTKSQ